MYSINQKLALKPGVVPTWENCTALFFMQLARAAWSRLQRERKRVQPYYPLVPVFKGASPLTTALLTDQPLPSSPSLRQPSTFEPPEDSHAWRKCQKIEDDLRIIHDELARRCLAIHSHCDDPPP
jgi:hypothetical protein